ncbi:MAG TPA: protein kinase [bacterium]|nr:protein kinase [bacterium]
MKSLEKSFKEAALAVIAAENGIISPQKLVHIFSDWVNSPGVSIRQKLEEALPAENKALLDLLGSEELEDAIQNKSVEVLLESVNRIKEQTRMAVMPSSTQADSTSERLITDETPGRYSVQGELARGGAGRVLIALDRHIGREIAVKELLLDLKDKRDGLVRNDPQTVSLRNRFLREARVTGQLEHPSIVPVYEIGRHPDGVFYYTMRMVKGKTLAKAIYQANSLENRLELLPHFYNVCNAVAYAHSKGVINRDLKPSNVMIGEFGETVVLDWGLAKVKGQTDIGAEKLQTGLRLFLDADVGKTVVGYAIGTPSYMPPEQAEGNVDEIDETSDIYSLGAILFQLLTGKPPYVGKTASEILRKVVAPGNVNACSEEQSVPPELSAIAQKAMSKKKKDRYLSATELIEDLNVYMSGGKVKVYKYSFAETFKRFATKNKALFISSILVFLMLLVSTVVIGLYYEKEVKSKQTAQREKLISQYRTAQAFNEKATRLESQKQYLSSRIYAAASLYYNPANKKSPDYSPWFRNVFKDSDTLLADAASKFYHRQFHRGAVLETGIDINCQLTGMSMNDKTGEIVAGCDNGEIRVMNFKNLSTIRKYETETDINDISVSPDGTKYALSGLNGVFTLINSKDPVPAALLKNNSGFKCAEFSKTGEEVLACGVDLILRMINISSLVTVEFKGHSGSVNDAVFIDGKTIVSCGNDGFVRVWDVATGLEQKKAQTEEVLVKVAVSDDGATIIAGSENGVIYSFSLYNMNQTGKFVQHVSSVTSLSFSKDGDMFISSDREGKSVVWDKVLMAPLFTLEGHRSSVSSAMFLNETENIITAGREGFIRIWKRHGRINTPAFSFNSPKLIAAAISKNGWMVIAPKNDELSVIKKETGEKVSFNNGTPVFDVDINHEGNMVAVAGWDTAVTVYERSTGAEKFKLKGNENAVISVKFSPDGKYIALSGKDGSVRLFSAENGEQISVYRCSSGGANNIAFSHDSKVLAAVCDNGDTVLLGIKDLGVEKLIQRNGTKPLSIAFMKGDRKIVTGYYDHSLYITDLDNNTDIELHGHTNAVTETDISDDGEFAVTASSDMSIKLWDIKENKEILTIPVSKDPGCAFFVPGEKSVAVCDGGTLKIYPLTSSDLEMDPKILLEKVEKEAGAKLKDFYLEAGM